MTDDPLDLTQVTADDAAVEQLRLGAPAAEDSALQLLHDLLVDLDAEPVEQPRLVPVGSGSTVLRLAGESTPDSRLARGGAVVALIAAGMVALGGVAAASTAVAPGNPLHGLGESVRSVAGAVVDAVKPPDTARRADPAQAVLPSPAASRALEALASRSAAPAATAAAARSDAAARQVAALLAEAEQLLDEGRSAAAQQRLDLAERRLVDVQPAAAADLRTQLEQLRDRAAQAVAEPRPRPADPGRSAPEPKPEPKGDAPAQRRTDQPEPARPEPARPEPAQPDPAGSARTTPDGGQVAPLDEADTPADRRTTFGRQPSRLASTKPRA